MNKHITLGHVGYSPDYKTMTMVPIPKSSSKVKDSSVVRWKSVSDKLPDDDITVLISDTENDVTLGFHDGESGWRYCSGERVGDPVTHWAELPEPPTTH